MVLGPGGLFNGNIWQFTSSCHSIDGNLIAIDGNSICVDVGLRPPHLTLRGEAFCRPRVASARSTYRLPPLHQPRSWGARGNLGGTGCLGMFWPTFWMARFGPIGPLRPPNNAVGEAACIEYYRWAGCESCHGHDYVGVCTKRLLLNLGDLNGHWFRI